MKQRGFETVAQLSREVGISQAILGKICNLKQHPVGKWGVIPSYSKLAAFFNVEPEDLWPGDLMEALSTNMAEREIDAADMYLLEGEIKDPETLMIEQEEDPGFLDEALEEVLKKLPEKHEEVIRLRWGLNGKKHTYQEVGEIIGVTRERVRQIEMRALRSMRHPVHSRKLRKFHNDPVLS
jgi:RNA polymerase sigma factor (sigma-70 family)